MNKKYISILLIFGILVSSLGLVTANDTLTNDASTTSATDSEQATAADPTDANSSENADSTESTQDNSTDDNANISTANISTENITTANNTTESYVNVNDVIESINSMDDNEFNAFINELNAKNTDGKFDAILKILGSDKIVYEKLFDELVNLDKDSFTLFVEIVESMSSSNNPVQTTHAKAVPAKDSASTFLEKTGISSAVNNIVNTFTPKNTPATQQKSDRIVHVVTGPQISDLVYEALDQYFKGNVSFEDLIAELDSLGIDTSVIKQNNDGTLTMEGINIASADDYLKAIEGTDSNNTNINGTDNSTSTDNSTDVDNSTAAAPTATSNVSKTDDSQAQPAAVSDVSSE